MRPQGRHLAHGAEATHRHPALVLCAAVLTGLCVVGLTGLAFLGHLDDLAAPYASTTSPRQHADGAGSGTSAIAGSAASVAPGTVPTSHADDAAWLDLVRSPITGLGVPERTRCDLPAPDPTGSTPALEQRLTVLTSCLDRAWQGPVQRAGLEFSPVAVRVLDPAQTSPGQCEQAETVVPAAYCEADRTIYVSPAAARQDAEVPDIGDLLLVAAVTHEYGHHLQSLTGLAGAVHAYTADHPEAEPELTRRLESMATCLGASTHGLLDGSPQVTQGFYEHMVDPETYRPDPAHGSGATQARWARAGYDDPGVTGRCATFSAPDELVA